MGQQQRLGLTYVFSHDLAVVEALCDRVMVMYFGKVVEEAERTDLFARPKDDYARRHDASEATPQGGRVAAVQPEPPVAVAR